MVLFTREKKILAFANYSNSTASGHLNCLRQWFGPSPIYLYNLLTMSIKILGISAYYHDSAACLLVDGEIIAAAQEERFTRKKHDASFPSSAVRFCLRQGRIQCSDLDYVVYYEKPLLKFERLLETYLAFAPRGVFSFIAAMPIWLKEKLFLKKILLDELDKINGAKINKPLLFTEHHEAHAASAFYCSPFEEAAILILDGVGEWATTSLGYGHGNEISFLKEIKFPHSLGLLYSAFTYYTGFKVNSGEYKVMGLAPYGEPKYVKQIKENLIDIKEDGSFRLNLDYFDYCTGLTMTNERFDRLFGGPPRRPESKLTQREMDLAKSIQIITEEVMLKMSRYLKQEIGKNALCLAGGVALNCVANGLILKEGIFKDIWIQPAAGDAGGAVGAALAAWHRYLNNSRFADGGHDAMKGAYLGPEYSENEVKDFLDGQSVQYTYYGNQNELVEKVSALLIEEKVVGWFQGRMEFGPRALGNRSILGDARSPRMQSTMNLKIKFRESFRPFAPSILREKMKEYFELDYDSPYMLLVAPVRKERRIAMKGEQERLWGFDKLNALRSDIPAVTHVDYSARIQTVYQETNPLFWELIKKFEDKTECAVIVNTSFNVRGEPIVCSPADAYLCFMRTEIDYLILDNFFIDKKLMKPLRKDINWRKELEGD